MRRCCGEVRRLSPGRRGRATGVRTLASSSYLPDPSGYMSIGINKVLVLDRVRLDLQLHAGDRVLVAQALSGG